MSINGGREAANENAESGKKPVNIDNITTKVYNDFVSNGITAEGVNFVNRIMVLPESDTSYQDEFMNFINSKKEFDELGEDFRNKMSLGKIKARLAPEYAKYKSRRLEMKSLIRKYYDVNESTYTQNYESHILSLTYDKLKEYSRSSEMLAKFFRDFSLEAPKRKNVKCFLETLDIETKLRSFSPEKRQELEYEISEVLQGTSVSSPIFARKLDDLIQRLLHEGVFDAMQKKELILAFIPTLSLKAVQEYGLMSEVEIDDYIKRELISDIDRSQRDAAQELIKTRLSEIIIPTSLLRLNSDDILNNIISNSDFEMFARELQDFHHLNSEGAIGDFETLIDIIKAQLPGKVAQIENFRSGNILILHAKNGNQDEVQYHEIIATESENPPKERLTFKNRGGNGVYNATNERIEPPMSYGDFYKLVSNQKLVQKAEIVARDYFDTQVESGEISQVEGEYSFEVSNASGDYNSKRLEQAINLLDSQGKKYGLAPGLTFQTSGTLQNGGDDMYTLMSINESKLPAGEIVLMKIDGNTETLSFEQFFEAWKLNRGKPKRVARVNSGEELVSDVNTEKSVWSQVKFESGKLLNQAYEDKGKQEVEFLVGDKNISLGGETNLIKIHSINGNTAKVSFGKYEGKQLPDSKNKKPGKGASYSVENKKVDLSLGMLAAWTKEANMQAHNFKGQQIEEKLPEEAKLKGGFGSYYVNNFASITSMLAAGKMWTENMKNYFEDGKNEQAMKLASKLPVFSDEQRASMTLRLENASKKAMNDALELLKNAGSGKVIPLIEKWITNKYTTEARKEAALTFMLEKYGVLYEKGPLMKYKGTFLWYQALGGRVGDELYQSFKTECEKATPRPTQFTEARLIIKLLGEQVTGKLKPERRSKFNKEIKKLISVGIDEEYQTGEGDTANLQTYKKKEENLIDELANGASPIAAGGYKKLLDKGGDSSGNAAQRLMCLPFVILTSGAANSFDENLIQKFKVATSLPGNYFTESQGSIDIFNNTILQLCKDIEQKLPQKYAGIYSGTSQGKGKDYTGGIKGIIQGNMSEHDKVWASYEFYLKYQDVLGRALLGLNTRLQDEESVFETWLQDNAESKPIYKSYLGLKNGALPDLLGANKESNLGWMQDAFKSSGGAGNGGITGHLGVIGANEYLKQRSGTNNFVHGTVGDMVWKEYVDQIYATKDNTFLTEEVKRSRLKKLFNEVITGIGNCGSSIDGILNNPTNKFYVELHNWGVKSGDFIGMGENFGDTLQGKKALDRYVKTLLSQNSPSVGRLNTYSIEDIIKNQVADNLNQSPFNRYDNAA